MLGLERLRPRATEPADRTSILRLLQQTPVDDLDALVARLKSGPRAQELRLAYIDLLGLAPLEHFQVLRAVYLKHLAR
jgi:hypothetical protein